MEKDKLYKLIDLILLIELVFFLMAGFGCLVKSILNSNTI